MTTKIESIWGALEEATEASGNLTYRRFSPDTLPDVYVALKLPEKTRCLALYGSNDRIESLGSAQRFRGIGTEVLQDSSGKNHAYYLIVLHDTRFRELFSVLCEDLIFSVSKIVDGSKLVDAIQQRLKKWKHMFEGAEMDGLTAEEQRGLFGELVVLRDFIRNGLDPVSCIQSWNNPIRSLHDFQYPDIGVEVKTSLQRDNISIRISNENQLDTHITKKIFLYHLIIRQSEGDGESLIGIVEDLCSILCENERAVSMLKFNLANIGYYEHQKLNYQDKHYKIIKSHIHELNSSFPRIEKADLAEEVHDVQYSIAYPIMGEWEVTLEYLISVIKVGFNEQS